MEKDYNLKTNRKDIWNYLHTISVYMPEQLNEDQQTKAENLIKGVLYFGSKPEEQFHKTITNYLMLNKMNLQTRTDTMLYLCHLHNEINKQEGKELFLCTKENITRRWGGIGDNNTITNLIKNLNINTPQL